MVEADIKKMADGLGLIEKQIAKSRKVGDADFARTMGPFSEASAETIQGVRDDFDVFRATFQQACKFLVMDPKKTEPEQLMGYIVGLLVAIEKTHAVVIKKRKLAEKRAKQEAERSKLRGLAGAARKASTANGVTALHRMTLRASRDGADGAVEKLREAWLRQQEEERIRNEERIRLEEQRKWKEQERREDEYRKRIVDEQKRSNGDQLQCLFRVSVLCCLMTYLV